MDSVLETCERADGRPAGMPHHVHRCMSIPPGSTSACCGCFPRMRHRTKRSSTAWGLRAGSSSVRSAPATHCASASSAPVGRPRSVAADGRCRTRLWVCDGLRVTDCPRPNTRIVTFPLLSRNTRPSSPGCMRRYARVAGLRQIVDGEILDHPPTVVSHRVERAAHVVEEQAAGARLVDREKSWGGGRGRDRLSGCTAAAPP